MWAPWKWTLVSSPRLLVGFEQDRAAVAPLHGRAEQRPVVAGRRTRDTADHLRRAGLCRQGERRRAVGGGALQQVRDVQGGVGCGGLEGVAVGQQGEGPRRRADRSEPDPGHAAEELPPVQALARPAPALVRVLALACPVALRVGTLALLSRRVEGIVCMGSWMRSFELRAV